MVLFLKSAVVAYLTSLWLRIVKSSGIISNIELAIQNLKYLPCCNRLTKEIKRQLTDYLTVLSKFKGRVGKRCLNTFLLLKFSLNPSINPTL